MLHFLEGVCFLQSIKETENIVSYVSLLWSLPQATGDSFSVCLSLWSLKLQMHHSIQKFIVVSALSWELLRQNQLSLNGDLVADFIKYASACFATSTLYTV